MTGVRLKVRRRVTSDDLLISTHDPVSDVQYDTVEVKPQDIGYGREHTVIMMAGVKPAPHSPPLTTPKPCPPHLPPPTPPTSAGERMRIERMALMSMEAFGSWEQRPIKARMGDVHKYAHLLRLAYSYARESGGVQATLDVRGCAERLRDFLDRCDLSEIYDNCYNSKYWDSVLWVMDPTNYAGKWGAGHGD